MSRKRESSFERARRKKLEKQGRGETYTSYTLSFDPSKGTKGMPLQIMAPFLREAEGPELEADLMREEKGSSSPVNDPNLKRDEQGNKYIADRIDATKDFSPFKGGWRPAFMPTEVRKTVPEGSSKYRNPHVR